MLEIAREAGVGVGTVCRNFPTKQDLIDAVLERAQDAGAVRTDISPADLSTLFAGIAQLVALSDGCGDALR